MDRPLTGYVVADFTHVFAGPWATQALADAGATVIKIEPPGGEFTRNQGPQREGRDGRSVRAWATALNAGKHSIELDLKVPEDRERAEQIVLRSDVVIESFRPGTMAALGVDLELLRAKKPELISCSISLRGAVEGPVRAGLSIVAEAEGSVMATQRELNGTPRPFGFALADIATGMTAYGAIVTALAGRARGALGRHIDISMVASVLAMNGSSIATAQMSEVPGAQSGMPAAMGVFATKDGYITIGVNSDLMFQRFCAAAGFEWMLADERYARQAQRDSRTDEVNEHVVGWTSSLTSTAAVDMLTAAKVPCGQVTTPQDVLDVHVGLTNFLRTVNDGAGGSVLIPVNPYGYDAGNRLVTYPEKHSEAVERLLSGS